MKNIILVSMLTLALIALPAFAAQPKIMIRQEVAPREMSQANSATVEVAKDNRLSSKRIKDKTEMTTARVSDAAGRNMIRYKTFKDGDGAAKTR